MSFATVGLFSSAAIERLRASVVVRVFGACREDGLGPVGCVLSGWGDLRDGVDGLLGVLGLLSIFCKILWVLDAPFSSNLIY